MSDRPSARPVDRGSASWPRKVLVAVTALGLLAASGCNKEAPARTGGAEPVRLYGSDGNMTDPFGTTFKDAAELLNGMRGTAPLTPLPEDFKQRLKAINPALDGFQYAAEAYDAVLIAALAAETARSVDSPLIAKYMTSVTVSKDPNGACTSMQSCVDGVRAGKDIAYRGMSMRRSGLTDGGEPSSASYGTLTFGRNTVLDQDKTEFVAAGDEKTEAKDLPAPPAGGQRKNTTTPLRIGSLLPASGDLKLFGPPIFAGVELAINEVNALGGVLGVPVQYLRGDDGTNPNVAIATADRLIGAGVQVIIGAGGSGITKAVIPRVTAAQRVMISPSATSDELSGLTDNGFFFRTSPPDFLQSRALTDVIMRYGPERLVIVARDDTYGIGLQDKVADQLRAAGLKPDRLKLLKYEVRTEYSIEQFADLAKEIADFTPDSVLVIGFEESGNMIKALSARGVKFRN